MPRWLGRVIYAFRGKRRVRLHLEDRPGVPAPSIEGIMLGRWCGHYVLIQPKVLHTEDRTIPLEGTVEVPAERVVFVQVLHA